MVDWTSSTVQIIIALISGSGILSVGITGYLSAINTPNINISVIENGNKSIVEITNIGKTSATNLVLTLLNKEIITNPIIFNSENISDIEVNSNSIRMIIPRLVQGDGAIIKLYLNSSADKIDNIYITSNEGSTVLNKENDDNTLSIIIWVAIIFISLNYIGGLFIIILLKRKGKNILEKEQKKFISDVFRQMIKIRNHLYNNINSKIIFKDEEQLWHSTLKHKISLMYNIKDLIIIDDFYGRLSARNSIIDDLIKPSASESNPEKNIHDSISNLNKMFLDSLIEALNNIDWEKYKLLNKGIGYYIELVIRKSKINKKQQI